MMIPSTCFVLALSALAQSAGVQTEHEDHGLYVVPFPFLV
jgi:hypothetical protein